MSKKIIFIDSSTVGYGADLAMIELIKKFKKSFNIDSVVVTVAEGRTTELLSKENIEYVIIPFKIWIHFGSNVYQSIIKPKLKKIYNELIFHTNIKKIKDLNPIAIYNNSFTNDFGIRFSNYFKVPLIQHIREFGDKDFNWNFDMGFNKTINITAKNAKLIICISKCVLNNYVDYVYDKEKIIYMYDGLYPSKKKKEKYNYKSNLKLIMIGRVSEEKGYNCFIEALNLLKLKYNVEFNADIYGDGEQFNEIKEKIKLFDLEKNVNMLGYVEDIPISSYDIGFMCSKSEGFGRTTIEYMMNGLPVIGTKSGATPEIIVENETGLIFDVNNSEQLASKINYLNKNRKIIEKFGKNGYKRAMTEFLEDKCLLKICNTVLNKIGENGNKDE